MAENTTPGIGDLLGLLSSNNPLTGVTRSVAQFQHGINELLSTIENLNTALDQFNQITSRVNRMLDLVEEPMKAFIPQVTRTVRAADELVERLSVPVDMVAPGLTRLAETLSSPVLTALPRDLNEFLGVLRDLARRLQPLGQMAETAGGLFSRGPFASFLGGSTRPEPSPTPTVVADVVASAPTPTRSYADDDDDGVEVDEERAPRPTTTRRSSGPVHETPTKRPAKAAPAKRAPAKRATRSTAKSPAAKRAAPPR